MRQQNEEIPISTNRAELLTKGQRRMALGLAGLPLGLWLILFAINPTYATVFFTEACGVAMVVALFVCVGIGYIALLGSFALANRLEPPSWLMHKTTLRLLLLGCVIPLFMLPALYLVWLGPAVIVLIQAGVADSVP